MLAAFKSIFKKLQLYKFVGGDTRFLFLGGWSWWGIK